MKKIILTILLIISVLSSFSQQATDIDSQSLIVPRYANLTAITAAIPSPQTGMMVYNIGTQSYWYYNGSWTNFSVTVSGNSWATTGNASTNPASNFFGTTDNNDLVFKRNNILVGKIDDALNNTSFGQNALAANISGDFNTALGYYALATNTYGHRNTAIGQKSLLYNTTGAYNTAIGLGSLFSNSSGYSNTANGYGSMQSNTAGFGNTANGLQALYANTIGEYNTANGLNSLYRNTYGNSNTASGTNAANYNTTGDGNTAMGASSLFSNSTGGYNTAYGTVALSNLTTGNNNIGLGAGVNVPNNAGNYQMSIGNVIYGADMSTTASGRIGIGVQVPTEKLEVAGKTKTTDLQVLNGVRIEGPATLGSGIKALSLGGYGDFGVDVPGIINGRFLVKENGNVGIGVTNPLFPLSVKGRIQVFDLGAGESAGIWLNSIGNTQLNTFLGINPANDFGIYSQTLTSNVFTVKMSNGNIGINTQTPKSKLEVNGTLATKLIITNFNSTLDETASVWIFTQPVNVTFPDASMCENRRYVIVNRGNNFMNVNNSNYINFSGFNTYSIPANSSIEIISDGTNWLQIK